MRLRLAWVASLVLVLAASAAADDLYRYRDADGQLHFTDSYYEVPEQYRDQLEAQSGAFEGRGSVSVVPGFGERPGQADAQGGAKGKGGRAAKGKAAKDAGFAAKLAERVAALRPGEKGGPSPGLLVFAALLAALAALALGAALLKTACNFAGERPLALGTAMLVVLIQSIAGALASGALNLTLAIAGQPGPLGGGIGLAAGAGATLAVHAAVLKGMHCETWGMALRVTLIAVLLAALLAAPLVYLALR